MVFSSPTFLFLFLPLVFLLNLGLSRSIPARNVLLTVLSVLFYAWGEPVYVLLMLFTTLVNYLLAFPLAPGSKGRRLALFALVLWNIGSLVAFKYTDFLIGAVNGLLGTGIPLTGIPLPIGVSFFTFQAMSYGLDVYRGVNKPQKNFHHILLYISLFPQLIAGPIVKYHDVAEQIKVRTLTLEKTAAGLRRFAVGLGKKVLLSNVLAVAADGIYALPLGEINAPIAWLGAIAYLFQIYFDFSGYSDMAIGLGQMFGFDFKENFRYPYAAVSMQDFWRRWHISLSSWFREYVYIPLGGNRKGKWRTGFHKIIVFFLTGLWHGASWNFVIWGLFHGLFLMLESYGVLRPERWPAALRRGYTLLTVTVGFVFFRAESLSGAVGFLGRMFGGWQFTADFLATLSVYLPPITLIVLLISIVACLPVGAKLMGRLTARRPGLAAAGYVLAGGLFLLCVLNLSTAAYNPFIYFRF